MAVTILRCSVLGGNVACVSSAAGRTITVICPGREALTSRCRLKSVRSHGGPLSELLERERRRAQVRDHTGSTDCLCHVRVESGLTVPE
jgi:hypothetical protein